MFFLEYVIKPPSTTRGGMAHKKESCFKMDLEETIHDTFTGEHKPCHKRFEVFTACFKAFGYICVVRINY